MYVYVGKDNHSDCKFDYVYDAGKKKEKKILRMNSGTFNNGFLCVWTIILEFSVYFSSKLFGSRILFANFQFIDSIIRAYLEKRKSIC